MKTFLAGAATALIIATFSTADPSARVPSQQPSGASPDDDPASPVFTQLCSRCHDAARIVAVRRSKTEWEEMITKMIEKGAMGSERDFETVYDYLLRHYGKAYVNTSTADDLTSIVGLSKKDAEAIVAYRKANGAFADFEAVKKVPDIDVKKLEERKDAVAF